MRVWNAFCSFRFVPLVGGVLFDLTPRLAYAAAVRCLSLCFFSGQSNQILRFMLGQLLKDPTRPRTLGLGPEPALTSTRTTFVPDGGVAGGARS